MEILTFNTKNFKLIDGDFVKSDNFSEMRGLTFVFNEDGSLFKRYLLFIVLNFNVQKFWLIYLQFNWGILMTISTSALQQKNAKHLIQSFSDLSYINNLSLFSLISSIW